MKAIFGTGILHFFIVLTALGQGSSEEGRDSVLKPVRINLELQAGATSNKEVPFWLRSQQFGSVPVYGASASFIGSVFKEYSTERKLFDWGAGLEGRANAGSNQELTLIQGYAKVKVGPVQLKAGRSRDQIGLTDPLLSSGSFVLSGNAPGVPNVELSVPEFAAIPFTAQVLALKGTFSHGWMGKEPQQYNRNGNPSVNTFLHLASLYGRVGKPDWKFKFYGGATHAAMWGSDREIFGNEFDLNGGKSFYYAATGKHLEGVRDISKVGNHLGTVDVGFEYDFGKVKALFYRQFFYDKGALGYLANAKDGLNSLSLENKASTGASYWKKLVLEVFYSKHQAGEEDAEFTPSGAEYYYNHGVYTNGYSYRGFGLGTPLITPARFARAGQASNPANYFINNRVLAFHLASTGKVSNMEYLIKLTYSRNWGEYTTSDVDYWFNGVRNKRDPVWGLFEPVNQFSGFAQMQRPLKNGFRVGAAVAVDNGKLLYNSVGGFLTLSKSW